MIQELSAERGCGLVFGTHCALTKVDYTKMGTTLISAGAAIAEMPYASSPTDGRTDQRARGRYPISLDLQYKLLRGGRVEQVGTGRTLNISSGGVLFETKDLLPPRGAVELAMHWPFLLQGVCGLKLVMRGRIVRSGESGRATAVRADFHEFRTSGIRQTRGDANVSTELNSK